MPKLNGPMLAGQLKEIGEYPWTDPTTGQIKLLRSFKVLVNYPDGTATIESVGFPNGYQPPKLELGQFYLFPATCRYSKKKQTIYWSANPAVMPFLAPDLA